MAHKNNNTDKDSSKREKTSDESTRNIYGGDTSNFGNASQGGVDPGKWKEVAEDNTTKKQKNRDNTSGDSTSNRD